MSTNETRFDRYATDAILRMHWINKKWNGNNKPSPLQMVDRMGSVIWLGVWNAEDGDALVNYLTSDTSTPTIHPASACGLLLDGVRSAFHSVIRVDLHDKKVEG